MAKSQYYVSESDIGALFKLSGLPADFQRLFARDYVSLKETGAANEGDLSSLTIRVDDVEDSLTLTITNLSALTTSYNAHAAAASAHGATGNLVGTGNLATLATGGVVRLAAAIASEAASTVVVTNTPNAAPLVYAQADAATWVTLLNELKSDLNQLVTDHNSLVTKVNSIIASDVTAAQRAP